jgi:hypothetical protein
LAVAVVLAKIGAVTSIELFAGVLWIALIGWFLDNAASAQAQEVTFQGVAG